MASKNQWCQHSYTAKSINIKVRRTAKQTDGHDAYKCSLVMWIFTQNFIILFLITSDKKHGQSNS